MSQKYFYLHIPKTAGTTFNDFLAHSFIGEKCSFHIEIEKNINVLLESSIISGHLPLPKAKKSIPNFENYIKLTVFRDPLKQVSSHLRFVKKLSEPSEKERLLSHSLGIQKIVAVLKETDLSSPLEIKLFIKWLEDEKLVLFHNSQIQYLIASGFRMTEKQVEEAIKELHKIDYVGITERLDDYMNYLSTVLNFRKKKRKSKRLNITVESYGLDIHNKEIEKVLEPLICYDKIIYGEAKIKFEKDFSLVVRNRTKGFYLFLDKIRAIVKR